MAVQLLDLGQPEAATQSAALALRLCSLGNDDDRTLRFERRSAALSNVRDEMAMAPSTVLSSLLFAHHPSSY